jgi:hypothetical protein
VPRLIAADALKGFFETYVQHSLIRYRGSFLLHQTITLLNSPLRKVSLSLDHHLLKTGNWVVSTNRCHVTRLVSGYGLLEATAGHLATGQPGIKSPISPEIPHYSRFRNTRGSFVSISLSGPDSHRVDTFQLSSPFFFVTNEDCAELFAPVFNEAVPQVRVGH